MYSKVVRVLPDVPAIDKTFDYLAPDDVGVGTMVRIPLHGRRVGGWVVAEDVEPPAGKALKAVTKVTGVGPPADLVHLAAWAAWRWTGRRATFLRTASPPTAVRGLPPPAPPVPPAASVGDGGLVGDAFARTGPVVVRLPPAADPFPFVLARHPALVLAPSLDAAAGLAGRLRRAGRPVALVPRDWARAAAGGTTVVGARAAAWAPVPDLAAVVVLDAHDEVYQEERAPTWNAWQVAAERARRAGVPCVLLSPCPSLDVLAVAEPVLPARAEERAGWSVVDVVDRRRDDPRSGLYSERLVDALRSGGRVVCVLNRKGRSRLLSCAACGELARCAACDAAVEQDDADLRCRRCGTTRPTVCAACGGTRLKNLRVGVTRVREELEALAGVPVGEVTGESDELPSTHVLVGTEAVLHRVTAADTVAFLDVDQELLAPRFRAAEQALALLARAARVVGGRSGHGRLLLQTRLPDHEVVAAALHADPGRVAVAEAPRRTALRLPPTTALAVVSGEAADAFVDAVPSHVDRLGPVDGRTLLRAPDHRVLCDALAGTPRPPGRLRVEVDPLRV
jgi:primosomal protein N' (replication factor Y)